MFSMKSPNFSSKLSIISFIVLIFSAALSYRPIFSVGPIQPNLILISLIVLGFFTRSVGFFILLAALSSILARQTPVLFDSISVGVSIGGFLAFFVKQRAVWPDRMGVGLLVALGTLAMHAVVGPSFIFNHPGALVLEILAAIVFALALFELLSVLLGRSHE